MSGIVLDLIVIGFITATACFFKKKGLIMALFSLVAFVLSFISGALLRPFIFDFLINHGFLSLKTDPAKLLIANILIYFSISIMVMVVLFVVGRFLKIFSVLPIIGTLNSIAGMFLGIFIGIAICSVLFSVLSMADTWVDTSGMLKIVHKSYLSEKFYENNLFFILQ